MNMYFLGVSTGILLSMVIDGIASKIMKKKSVKKNNKKGKK